MKAPSGLVLNWDLYVNCAEWKIPAGYSCMLTKQVWPLVFIPVQIFLTAEIRGYMETIILNSVVASNEYYRVFFYWSRPKVCKGSLQMNFLEKLGILSQPGRPPPSPNVGTPKTKKLDNSKLGSTQHDDTDMLPGSYPHRKYMVCMV